MGPSSRTRIRSFAFPALSRWTIEWRPYRDSKSSLRFNVATGQATLLQILLVIVLSRIELHRGDDLRRNRLGVAMGFLQSLLRGLRGRLLLGRVEKDGGAILRAPIRTLPVDLRGVVILPENFQQLAEAHLGRIEVYFHGFGMPGAVGADFFVRGVVSLSADVADARPRDSGHRAESGFYSPETSRCECGFLHGYDGSLYLLVAAAVLRASSPAGLDTLLLDDELAGKSLSITDLA
jgi:hypothetical protein